MRHNGLHGVPKKLFVLSLRNKKNALAKSPICWRFLSPVGRLSCRPWGSQLAVIQTNNSILLKSRSQNRSRPRCLSVRTGYLTETASTVSDGCERCCQTSIKNSAASWSSREAIEGLSGLFLDPAFKADGARIRPSTSAFSLLVAVGHSPAQNPVAHHQLRCRLFSAGSGVSRRHSATRRW